MLTRINEAGNQEICNSIVIEDKEVVPMLGTVVLELIKESVSSYKAEMHKVGDHLRASGFEIVDSVTEPPTRVPFKKGRIVAMATDAFGERYKKNYGTDCQVPRMGDVVMFSPNQQYNLDPAGKYALMTDEKIFCILRDLD